MNLVVGIRCHYCSKFRHPKEVLRLPGGPIMCWRCLEWHQKARDALSGHPPPGCQQCGVTFAQLQERAGSGDVSMCIHVKDGIYQVLCRTCSDKYAPKRVDLYGATEFGRALRLAG
jgi:hypothetical protein